MNRAEPSNRPAGRAPTPAKLRSLALEHQGLAGKRGFGTALKGVEKTLNQIGHVQIDTISVVARAHHHILYNRVNRYDESLLNRLVKARRAFEYWSHAASYLPMRDYRFVLPMMRGVARGEWGWWHHGANARLRAWVLDRIGAEGPLFARDFENPGNRRSGWWDWKPAKRALEHLFMAGELMCIERQGLQKRYELAERFLPSDVDTHEPDIEEHADFLIDATLRAHGFATARTVNYLRRDAKVKATVRHRLVHRVRAGDLALYRDDAGETIYALPGAFDRAPKRFAHTVHILSPFDNVVIQRRRAVEVFDFDYTIECYVPASKRVYGYFALPLLYRDRLIGRMDCKARRSVTNDGDTRPPSSRATADWVVPSRLASSACVSFAAARARTSASMSAYSSSTRAYSSRNSGSFMKRDFSSFSFVMSSPASSSLGRSPRSPSTPALPPRLVFGRPQAVARDVAFVEAH